MDFYLFLEIWVNKTLSGRCSQKLLDDAKQSSADALKTSSKRAIQKQQMQVVI